MNQNKQQEKFFGMLNLAALVLGVYLFANAAFGPLYFLAPMDSTDTPTKRSGMSLYVDAFTGCHYLGRGGLTPRLDQNGKQICTGERP